jgi:thiamine-phosphate pyrophosphorylase
MDAKLLAWALRVKPRATRLPRLWLFTDVSRLPDPLAAVALLPRGAAGVVLRPEGMGDELVARIAGLCRARRLTLSVAGDARLAARLHAGRHWRGGRPPAPSACAEPALTGSAHTLIEVRRCRRAGVRLVFVSPVFATASHPGGRALGVRRWAALARLAGGRAAALGGIDGRTVRGLPATCRAVGAIGALHRSVV